MTGMMLHIDGSKHRWFQDDRDYDLISEVTGQPMEWVVERGSV